MNIWVKTQYPCAIVRDRYSGAYSGAEWLAFPVDWWNIPDELEGGDAECMMFWDAYDGVVGKGVSPQAAFEDLVEKMNEKL